eukprot:jgi/Orpsp1_1/1176625/evm.model.c7180000058365.1
MDPSKPSIDRVINEAVITSSGMNLLHLICSNSLGEIIRYIFYVADSLDVFNIQDDDGNTPFHLLCKRIDFLSLDYDHILSGNDRFGNPKNYLDSEYINYITSVPSSTSAIELLRFFSDYADFSIRNKNYKRIHELVNNNIIVNNIYYIQMVKKSKNKFPSKRPERPTELNGRPYYYNNEHIEDWNALFKFQCPKRRNRTLLHFLMMGDRLEAIKFLVDLGADINYRFQFKNRYGNITYGDIAISYLFSNTSVKYGNKYKPIVVPSGFLYPLSFKTGHIEDNKYLREDEKIILKETEKIVEFFMNNSCDLSLCEKPPCCDISNILFN